MAGVRSRQSADCTTSMYRMYTLRYPGGSTLEMGLPLTRFVTNDGVSGSLHFKSFRLVINMANLSRPGGLGSAIIEQLRRSGRPCTTSDLARSLRKLKPELNRALYDLQKKGAVTKVRESPPLWQLITNSGANWGAMTRRGRSSGGRGRGHARSPTPPSTGYQFDGGARYQPFPLIQESQGHLSPPKQSSQRGGASSSGGCVTLASKVYS